MKIFKYAASCMVAAAILSAVPAKACQGPQFESRLHIFSDKSSDDIAKGFVQLKVQVQEPKYWMKQYSQDFIFARVLEGEFAQQMLAIKMPLMTSCDVMAFTPKDASVYVTGQFAKLMSGEAMSIRGAMLFAVDSKTITRQKPGFQLQPQETQ